jgi:hypothetical protein
MAPVAGYCQDDETGTVIAPDVELDEDPEAEKASVFKNADPSARVETRKIAPGKITSLRDDEDFWYANSEKKKEPRKKAADQGSNYSGAWFTQPWFRTLVWIIIIVAFVAVVVLFLASSNISIFRSSPKAKKEEETPEGTEDIFTLDFDQEINKAIADKNFRQAVRFLYLRTLRQLADRGLIQYTHEKTNSEYVSQMFPTPHYRDFFRLTRDFEYTCYGRFEINDREFGSIHEDFSAFQKRTAA